MQIVEIIQSGTDCNHVFVGKKSSLYGMSRFHKKDSSFYNLSLVYFQLNLLNAVLTEICSYVIIHTFLEKKTKQNKTK